MPNQKPDGVNPWLVGGADGGDGDSNKGSPDSIQDPRNPINVVWQTRDHVPTDYENALGDALERIFADGIYDLPGIVERLNRDGPKPEAGEWTEESFQAEMKRLGG